jgi:hypothetical protein
MEEYNSYTVYLIEDVSSRQAEWMLKREKFITRPDFTTDPHHEDLAKFETEEEAIAELNKLDMDKINRYLFVTERLYYTK